MRILHVIKRMDDICAWETAARQAEKEGNHVSILLLQDAVFNPVQAEINTFACEEDVFSRGVKTDALIVDYEEIVTIILNTDSIICW